MFPFLSPCCFPVFFLTLFRTEDQTIIRQFAPVFAGVLFPAEGAGLPAHDHALLLLTGGFPGCHFRFPSRLSATFFIAIFPAFFTDKLFSARHARMYPALFPCLFPSGFFPAFFRTILGVVVVRIVVPCPEHGSSAAGAPCGLLFPFVQTAAAAEIAGDAVPVTARDPPVRSHLHFPPASPACDFS